MRLVLYLKKVENLPVISGFALIKHPKRQQNPHIGIIIFHT